MATPTTDAQPGLSGRIGAIPLAVGAAWGLGLAFFNDQRLQGLSLPAFDTAYFQQLAWGIFHGHIFRASFLQGNFLGLHFSPLLVLPAAVELAVPGAAGLNLVAATALGAVGPAAFLACREILPRSTAGAAMAAVLAVAAVFVVPLQEAAWSGFHTEEMALPLIFLATWAALRDRRLLLAALVVAVLLSREDQVYPVAVLGILLAIDPVRRRLGAWVLGAAAGWGLIVFLVLMPWLRQGQSTDTSGYYSWLTSAGPRDVAAALGAFGAWRVVALTVAGLLLLPLLRPGFALLAVPPVLAAALSRHQPQPLLQLQYGLPIVYPLVIAAALGGRRLLGARRPPLGLVWAAILPGIAVALIGPLPGPLFGRLAHPGPSHLVGLAGAMLRVPATAEVDADDSTAAAVASRADLHLLPHISPGAYVVVDRQALPPTYIDARARALAVQGLPRGRRLLWSNGRLELWSPLAGNPTTSGVLLSETLNTHPRIPRLS